MTDISKYFAFISPVISLAVTWGMAKAKLDRLQRENDEIKAEMKCIKAEVEKSIAKNKSETDADIDKLYAKIDKLYDTQSMMFAEIKSVGVEVNFLTKQFK